MRKLRSVQVLRGIAACAVVVHHGYRYVDPYSFVRVGSAGVDLFFVISGFIMATVGARQDPREFLGDRLWRIFPMWLIAMLPWLIILPHDSATALTSLTLWPIWHGAFHTPALLVGWTLCFEMLFYCAFALSLATRPLVPTAIFLICFAIGPQNALLNYLGSPLILEFLAGVLIARLPLARRGWLLMIIGLAWFGIAPVDYYSNYAGFGALLRVLGWGIPAALIVHGARSEEAWFERREFDFPVFLGNASYSIYLFHRLVMMSSLPWDLKIIGGVGLGIIAYALVERRIMRLRPRRSDRTRGASESGSVTSRLAKFGRPRLGAGAAPGELPIR